MRIEKTAALVSILVVASAIGGWAANVVTGKEVNSERLDKLARSMSEIRAENAVLKEQIETIRNNYNPDLRVLTGATITMNHLLYEELKEKHPVKAGELGGSYKSLKTLQDKLNKPGT